MNGELNKEILGLKNDIKGTEEELRRINNRMAFMLKGEMGEDIRNVLNGKVKVKLSFKEKLKYKFKNFIDKLIFAFSN